MFSFSPLFRLLPAALLLAVVTPSRAADWPQWRGPNRDGVSAETGWNTAWAAGGPKVLWKTNVGIGCSSFSVVGDHVFTMGNQGDTASVLCLDAKTGKPVWKHAYSSKLDPKQFEGGQCATPTIDGKLVFTLGRQGQLFCLNKDTGSVVWSKDLTKHFGARAPQWGYAGSPLVVGNLMLIDAGGKGASAIALDKTTGRIVWKAGDDPESYSSPFAFAKDGKSLVAFFNAVGVVVRETATGKEVSRFPWKTSYDINPTTPIFSEGKLFVASGYGHGGVLLQVDGANLTPVWQTKHMKNKFNSSVLWKGCLYGFDEAALNCLDFATGAVKWTQSGLGMGSLMVADGKLIIMAENGDLLLAEASSSGFKEIAKASAVVPTKAWVTPVLANGKIFCRNNNGDVACLDVSGK